MDDDSSSEDDLQRFKESVDQQFLPNDLYSNSPTKRAIVDKPTPTLPSSLRRNVTEEDEVFNIFRVTPEFQKYVAKHLSAKLEEEIAQQEVTVTSTETSRKQKQRGGIKLLSSSLYNVKICKEASETKQSVKGLRQQPELDEDVLQQQCMEAAVEGKKILQQEDVKTWSKRSKAQVFDYKKKNGRLEYQEKPFQSVIYE